MCTEPEAGVAEDVIAGGELADGGADRFDLSGKLGAEDRLPWPAYAGDKPAEKRDGRPAFSVGFARVDVQPVDRRGMHLDEDLVVLCDGPLDIRDVQEAWRPVVVVDNRPHEYRNLPDCVTRRRSAN